MNKKNYLIIGFMIFCFTLGINVSAKNVCKRATELHTETCNHEKDTGFCGGYMYSPTGYKFGDLVTYGSIKNNDELTSGDAFDCDVNGDGIYDSEKERFYYVTDSNIDSNYAVLIYYNNVSSGKTDNKGIYNPKIAKEQLPTTDQWKNVTLVNNTRNILDEKGTSYATFNYEGYAARFLTIQEINEACNTTTGTYKTGELDNCQFFMENTEYTDESKACGYWLDNVSSYYSGNLDMIWGVYGSLRYLSVIGGDHGVRPVIEVLKSEIDNEEKIEDKEEISKPGELNSQTKPTDKIKDIIKNPNTATFIGIVGIIFIINSIVYVILRNKKVKRF